MSKKVDFILFVALLFATLTAPAVVLSLALQTTCMVGTPLANNAIVRVQPGEAQRSLTYLFPGRQYPVTGHIVEADGSEWWSLDRAEFASRSLEADPWVSAAEVSPTGDCDALITLGSTEEATPAVESSIISVRATRQAEWSAASSGSIRAGIWELALTNVAVDCGEGEPLYLGPQVSDNLIPIDPSNMPESLLFVDAVFLSDGDGTYRGQYNLPIVRRVYDAEITLTVVSATFMTGTWAASIGNCDFESDVEFTHMADD